MGHCSQQSDINYFTSIYPRWTTHPIREHIGSRRETTPNQERAPLQLAPVFWLQMMEKNNDEKEANVTIETTDTMPLTGVILQLKS